MLLSSVIFIDGSATIIALPLLGMDFHLTGAQLQWLLNTYLLPLTALSLVAGAIGDRYGRQRTLLFGDALFSMSLILCSRAESLEVLLAGRVGQGIGAAFLIPNALAGIGQMYSARAEERAIGVWSGFAAVASGMSPTLGGWLVDLGNWRGLFLLSLPIVVIDRLLDHLRVIFQAVWEHAHVFTCQLLLSPETICWCRKRALSICSCWGKSLGLHS